MNSVQKIAFDLGYDFQFCMIANEDFNNRVLQPILKVSGGVSEEELTLLQDKGYCGKNLGISFPLLVRKDDEYDKARYYATPLTINGGEYVLGAPAKVVRTLPVRISGGFLFVVLTHTTDRREEETRIIRQNLGRKSGLYTESE